MNVETPSVDQLKKALERFVVAIRPQMTMFTRASGRLVSTTDSPCNITLRNTASKPIVPETGSKLVNVATLSMLVN